MLASMGRGRTPWQRLGEQEGPTVFPALGISFLPMAPLDMQDMVRRIERRSRVLTQLTTTIQDQSTKRSRTVVQSEPRGLDASALLDEGQRLCDAKRDGELEASDLPEEAIEQWRRMHHSLAIQPVERIVAQSFLQLELLVVDVTYSVGRPRERVSFLGRALRPLPHDEELLFTRRAQRLRWWAGALALFPPALLASNGLRGSSFLRDETALLLAASALCSLLGFATLWRQTLQRPVRGWVAAMLISIALVGVAAVRVAPWDFGFANSAAGPGAATR